MKYDYFMIELVVQAFRVLMFLTTWPQIYYQTGKISKDWHHVMILEVVSNLT